MISGGQILWTVQDLLNEDLGNHFKDQLFHLVHWWNFSQNSERDKAIIHQVRKESINRNISGLCFDPGGIWKGDILKADIEELGKLDASEFYPRRLNAKEVLITHKHGEFVFPVTDGSATLSGRDYEFQESTLRRESTVRRENLKAIGKSFNLKKQKMTKKYMRICGLFKETSFIVIILNREFNYTCQEKNHSPFR